MKKNIITSLCIIAILPFLFSWGLERDTVISGKVQNPKSPHISINKQPVSLDPAGQFQYSVNLKKPAYFEVDFGKKAFLYLRPDLPPSIIFQGTADDVIPLWSVKEFAKKMTAAGNRCDLHIYEGQTHLNWGDNEADVLEKMDKFLESIGYLDL
jgi:acetyl esterase/lipase